MTTTYYKWVYSKFTIRELWDFVERDPIMFLIAIARFKIFRNDLPPSIGLVYRENLRKVEFDTLPQSVKERLENVLAECASEGLSVGKVVESAHLTPDFVYLVLLTSNVETTMNKILVHVSRTDPAIYRMFFSCTSLLEDNKVIETDNCKKGLPNPPIWNVENYYDSPVTDILKRHAQRMGTLRNSAKLLTMERSEEEILRLHTLYADYGIERGYLAEMTDAEIELLKSKIAKS